MSSGCHRSGSSAAPCGGRARRARRAGIQHGGTGQTPSWPGLTRERPHTRRKASHRIPRQWAARATRAPPFLDSIRSRSPFRRRQSETSPPTKRDVAAAKEGLFANQHQKEGDFRPRDRFPSRAADRQPGNATLGTDRPQPTCTNPTDSLNPMSFFTPPEMSAPSAQQEPLKQTDEGIRQLAEDREKNYREKQSVDAPVVLRFLEQEAETDG